MESQIKVRDLSSAKLTIEPADSTSWSDVRTELIAEKKALLRSELETELGAATDESVVEKLRADFSAKERKIEHEVDSQVMRLACSTLGAPPVLLLLLTSLSLFVCVFFVQIHTFSATIDIEVSPFLCKHKKSSSTPLPNSRTRVRFVSQYNFLSK